MRALLLLMLCLSANAIALEAVVTVLETPMLQYRSFDAPVVQYLRKGDVINIHPSVGNDPKFNEYAPSKEKLEQLQKELRSSPEYAQDPLFRGEAENTFSAEDEFIPVIDRQGHTVYVLSAHLYIYFKDPREFQQRVSLKDPTDYRLEEPLPKRYPLETISGYRGQFTIGLNQPYYESYPYKQVIRTKGYSSPLDLNLALLRQAPGNYQERLFIGGAMNLRYFSNSYTFNDRRLSEEKHLRLGVGPTISYDAFKGEKNRINLSGTVLVNFFDHLYIRQSLDGSADNRDYYAYSVAPRLGLQYHRKEVLEEIDFVLGTSLEVGAATSYRAKNAGSQSAWWRHLGNDKFSTRTTFTLGAYIGLQSAY